MRKLQLVTTLVLVYVTVLPDFIYAHVCVIASKPWAQFQFFYERLL